LSQNDKNLLLKQQLLLNRIKASPQFSEKAVAALNDILTNIENEAIAPNGLSSIFSILDTCLVDSNNDKFKEPLAKLFRLTVQKIKELTEDDIFLLRELDQTINPFVSLSYLEMNNANEDTDTNQDNTMGKNS